MRFSEVNQFRKLYVEPQLHKRGLGWLLQPTDVSAATHPVHVTDDADILIIHADMVYCSFPHGSTFSVSTIRAEHELCEVVKVHAIRVAMSLGPRDLTFNPEVFRRHIAFLEESLNKSSNG